MRNRLALAAVFLLFAGLVAAGVHWLSFSSALTQLERRGRADLALATDRFAGQLSRYRELSVFLSDHPSLAALAQGGGDRARVESVLQLKADQTGSLDVRLRARNGAVLAKAGDGSQNRGELPAFVRALTGAVGSAHYVGRDGHRFFTFAAPVFGPDGPAIAAVLVTVDIAEIEGNWPADPSAVYFTDRQGTVFASSRSELISGNRKTEGNRIFPQVAERRVNGHDLWQLDGGRYLPKEALHLTQPVPAIGMTGEILIDTEPARRIARLQASVAAALVLILGLASYLAAIRRRAMSEKLATEAAANAMLEERVARRTRELSLTNDALRREIAEKRETADALRKAQADLVLAGKLSALGQMSAGISHELNQPLMAIRSFAENGEAFLQRDQPERAGENLAKISELARRMGRIIKNLRAFARQEREEISDVDLVGVVDAVLELARRTLEQAGVTVDWSRPELPVHVRGGEVRLQQVVMNLVSNASDAMAGCAVRKLEISIRRQGRSVVLEVADSGPGIVDAEKIFDPFYTTKSVGHADGMGLGLSISYGLVQSFGGAIRGRNRPGGGAVFTVELGASSAEAAA